MSALKNDYKNDVLDTSVNTERTYNIVDDEGNVLYTGVKIRETTVLSQTGDSFGNSDINNTNNHLIANDGNGHTLDFQFATDGTDYGFIDGNGDFQAFKTRHTETATPDSRALFDMGVFHKKRYVNLSAVPNINTKTQTISAVYTSGNGLDLGEDNNVRYIKTSNLMVTPTAIKTITANGNNQDVLNHAKVNVAVNQTPSFSSRTPTSQITYTANNEYSSVTAFADIGAPSVSISKSGSTITVTLTESINMRGAMGGDVGHTRTIVVNMTI